MREGLGCLRVQLLFLNRRCVVFQQRQLFSDSSPCTIVLGKEISLKVTGHVHRLLKGQLLDVVWRVSWGYWKFKCQWIPLDKIIVIIIIALIPSSFFSSDQFFPLNFLVAYTLQFLPIVSCLLTVKFIQVYEFPYVFNDVLICYRLFNLSYLMRSGCIEFLIDWLEYSQFFLSDTVKKLHIYRKRS